jgi:CheY-like chemotaxis protein
MPNRLKVLLAEDEEIDFVCVQRASAAAEQPNMLRRVIDGEEAIRYLDGEGLYADRQEFPTPHVIVLDLKMPRKDGFTVLQWVRKHPKFFATPVIVMSTSGRRVDIEKAYQLGANTYFVKPMALAEFTELYDLVVRYWRKSPATLMS